MCECSVRALRTTVYNVPQLTLSSEQSLRPDTLLTPSTISPCPKPRRLDTRQGCDVPLD